MRNYDTTCQKLKKYDKSVAKAERAGQKGEKRCQKLRKCAKSLDNVLKSKEV